MVKSYRIKFKAKRLDNGEWVEGDIIHKNNGVYVYNPQIVNKRGYSVQSIKVDPLTVCQFTGLKDCKGNKIWEHDLIHFVGYKPTAEVIWSEDNYAFMVAASENEHLYLLLCALEIGKIERVDNKFNKESSV